MQGDTAFHWDCVQRSYQWNGRSSLASWMYLLSCDHLLFRVCFHSIVNVWWWEEAQPKNLKVNFISSRLPQSAVLPKPCRRQYFWLFCRNHVADCILITSPKPCRRCIFDDDLGHGNHSGELLLFVGYVFDLYVSCLICMFQDSVPARII